MIDNTVKHKLIFKNYQIYQTNTFFKREGMYLMFNSKHVKKEG